MKAAVLYGTSLRKTVIEFRRYPLDSLTGLVMMYGFFLMIFFGAKVFGGGQPGFGDTLESVVVSFALFGLTMFGLSRLTWEVVQEAQLGTLEQLSMSPYGLGRVFLARVWSGIAVEFTLMVVLLVLMMATTGRWLHIDVVSIVPILFVTMGSVIGLGFVLAGVAIVFKRVQQAMQVWQLAVFGLIVAPVSDVPFTKYLPLTWGATLLRRVMVEGMSIFAMPVGDLVFLAANGIGYLALGLAIFRRFDRVARERGLLGHY